MEEQWINLLEKVELDSEANQTIVLEKIKEFFKIDRVLYEDWEKNEFCVDHLLQCHITLDPVKKVTKKNIYRKQVTRKPISKSQTLLHLFSKFGSLNTVISLVKYGADVNKTNLNGSTPLLLAAVAGNLDIVKVLLNNGAKASMNKVNELGKTPLLYALKLGHVEIANYLIDNGARVDIKTHKNTTALHYAAMHDLDIVKRLIHLGADINAQTINGKTPMFSASKSSNLEVMKYLLEEKQVGVNFQDEIIGYTALYCVCVNIPCSIEAIKYLIGKGANFNFKTTENRTPVQAAAYYGRLDVIKYLVEELGANINIKDVYGHDELSTAVEQGHLEIAKYFIEEHNMSVDVMDIDKRSLLHIAVHSGNLDLVKYLTNEKGAKKYIHSKRSDIGWTPLHESTSKGYADIAKFLVEEGAKVNDTDYRGFTPLHRAAKKGHLGTIRLLVEKGANVNIKNKFWKTGRNVALEQNNLDVVNYLDSIPMDFKSLAGPSCQSQYDSMPSDFNRSIDFKSFAGRSSQPHKDKKVGDPSEI